MRRKRQLKWKQATPYAEISECGRYTMAGSLVMGVWVFEGWRRAKFKGEAPRLLNAGRITFAQDARDLCERDVARERKAS